MGSNTWLTGFWGWNVIINVAVCCRNARRHTCTVCYCRTGPSLCLSAPASPTTTLSKRKDRALKVILIIPSIWSQTIADGSVKHCAPSCPCSISLNAVLCLSEKQGVAQRWLLLPRCYTSILLAQLFIFLFFIFLTSLLEYNCFTMVCYQLLFRPGFIQKKNLLVGFPPVIFGGFFPP